MAGRKLPPFDAGFELTSPSKGRVFNGHMNKVSKTMCTPPIRERLPRRPKVLLNRLTQNALFVM